MQTKYKIDITELFIIMIYLSITFFWNLLPFDCIDVCFVIMMCYFIITALKKPIRIYKCISKEMVCLGLFVVFAVWQWVNTKLNVQQSSFETFLTIRELLYICVAFVFAYCCHASEKYMKLIVKLEIIGAVLYLITFLISRPISPFAPFEGGVLTIGSVSVYRDFCPIPLLTFFICPYLFLGITNKKYLWNKEKDIVACIIIFAELLLHFFRTRLTILVLEIVLICLFSVDKNKRNNFMKKAGRVLLVVLMVVVLIVTIPTLRNRLLEGLNDVMYAISGKELNPYTGTFTYRMWLLKYRIEYLIENHKFMFGLGAISSRNNMGIFGKGVLANEMATIYNPDNAYLTLFARYGLLGTIFYVGSLGYLALQCIKGHTQLSITVGICIFAWIFEGLSSNAAICEYGLVLVGMMVGLCMSEKTQLVKNIQ